MSNGTEQSGGTDQEASAGALRHPPGANARALYEEFAGALAYVAVRTPSGSERIGSAFHVGDGVFVTARHVVEGNSIVEMGTVARTYIRLQGEEAANSLVTVRRGQDEFKAHVVEATTLVLQQGPFYHPDPDIDVAVFQVERIDRYTPIVHLGDHLDDWLGYDDFVLSEVVILGFPPVPFAHGPHLIATRGEVNALINLRHVRHVHFIVSAIPRGGFSGGLVLAQSGYVLGLITQSLVMDSLPEQLGYMAVLSVEPIYVCLAKHRLLPAVQSAHWDDFWNSEPVTAVELPDGSAGILPYGLVEYSDDGKRLYLEVCGVERADRDAAVRAALQILAAFPTAVVERERGIVRATVERAEGTSAALALAAKAAALVLFSAGYRRPDVQQASGDDDDLPFQSRHP